MKTFRILFCALLPYAVCAAVRQGDVSANSLEARLNEQLDANPMRKIITMLQDMQKELEREGEMEAELFEKAMCVCEGGEKELKKVIDESTSAIAEFTAKIEAETAEQKQLGVDLQGHAESKSSAESDLSQAVALREKDHSTFVKKEKDTKTNLKQMGDAIGALERGTSSAALMQTDGSVHLRRLVEVTKYVSSDDRQAVLAFLDQGLGQEQEDGETVKVKASGEIIGILKNMKDEMTRDLAQMQEDEKTDLTNFNELKAAKQDEISINEKAIVTKDKRVGALALALAEDKHALEDSTEEKANAESFLATMDEECAKRRANRDMRNKMRTEEIAAISEAVKILNDDDALEVFKKAAPSAALMQQQRQTYDALLQLSEKGARLAKESARKPKLVLTSVSHQTRDRKEPGGVGKHAGAASDMVQHMIGGMVGVLHDEDVNDEHKKDWCANETVTAHGIEDSKNTLLAQTQSDISEMKDQIATLTEEIKDLTAQIAETDKMVHEATEQRKKEHQEFVDSFSTMATALRLVDKAMTRLHKFYNPEKIAKEKKAAEDAAMKKAGLALGQVRARAPPSAAVARLQALGAGFDALVQTASGQKVHHRVAPVELPDTPGTYVKKESGGVMGLMQDFKNDLKTDMTEGETEEKFAAKDYVRIMSEAQKSRAQDVKSLNNKKTTKASTDEKLMDAKELAMQTDKEIHNIELYLVQLNAECSFLMRNFDVRHEGRIEEETGLESAESIVTHEEPPTHKEVEEKFEEEHSGADVDKNWPDKFGAAEEGH